MLSLEEERVRKSFMAKPKIVATPVAPKRHVAGTTVRRAPPKKALAPYILQITILHEPDETGSDVVMKHTGQCPADIDPEALEQYIGDFFGEGDEDEYEEFEE